MVGSGKTTYARRLEGIGVTRLSLDEEIFRRHGRHGVDYPEHEYPDHRAAAVIAVDAQIVDLLRRGKSVALDFGFWSRGDRERYKALAESCDAEWRLLYFEATEAVLRERLRRRNARADTDPNALLVEDRHLYEFMSRFEPPHEEDETVIPQS
jgi:predicted kinase